MGDVLADHAIDTDGTHVPIGINAKDRHVVSTALLGEATILTTNDTALRNEVRTAVPALTPLSIDAFGNHLWQLSPGDVSRVIDSLVAKRTRPPISRDELLRALGYVVPSVAERRRQI